MNDARPSVAVLELARAENLGNWVKDVHLPATKLALSLLGGLLVAGFMAAVLANGIDHPGNSSGVAIAGAVLAAVIALSAVFYVVDTARQILRVTRTPIHVFERGLVARSVVFAWHEVRVKHEVTNFYRNTDRRRPYATSTVFTLTRPDGRTLRLDSDTSKEAVALGAHALAQANIAQHNRVVGPHEMG